MQSFICMIGRLHVCSKIRVNRCKIDHFKNMQKLLAFFDVTWCNNSTSYGTFCNNPWQGGSGAWVGVGCHVYHRRVDCPPQVKRWGYALDRGVLCFHFGGKWKPVRWSWGIGGMELIPILTQFNRFWSLGGSIWGGTGGKGPRKTNTSYICAIPSF